MISFHPTIAYSTYRKVVREKTSYANAEHCLQTLFPNNNITLTDSGRSALAVIIETLELQNKRIIVPAFICNVLLPIFQHYNIKPIFVDVDIATLQPKTSSYTSEILSKCDAVLLVPTYGHPIPQEIYKIIKGSNKIVIEDYAHCSLPEKPIQSLFSDARYYSLTKTLPVPDGGIAVCKTPFPHKLLPHKTTLSSVKEVFKLFAYTNFLITKIKEVVHKKNDAIQKWHGIRRASKLSAKLIYHFLSERQWKEGLRYCYPIFVNNPESAKRKLLKSGVISERIWLDPIICSKEIAKDETVGNTKDYQSTLLSAQFLICAPGWHIKTQKQEGSYKGQLKKILSSDFRCFRQEK